MLKSETTQAMPVGELVATLYAKMCEYGYAQSSLDTYRRICEKLLDFFEENGVAVFDIETGRRFVWECCGAQLGTSGYFKNYNRAIHLLSDLQRYGMIFKQSVLTMKDFSDEFKPLFEEYLESVRKSGIADGSVHAYRTHLFRLESFLQDRGLRHFDQIEPRHMNTYIETLSGYARNTISFTLTNLKRLMDFAYQNGYHSKTFSNSLPTVGFTQSSRLPAVFTADEVERILENIDNNNPLGKRNYAIILAVAKFGLRVSDALNLRFDSIDWDKKRISIKQRKTGIPLELPLLEDVGWAIIEYLKHGRPESNCKNIFVCHRPPYDELSVNFSKTISRAVQKAGIKTPLGKTVGTHTFRHSIATSMLDNGAKLIEIAQTLGHASPESSEEYIALNVNMLRQCALEVNF
ncbi:hypothetical protein FACS1894202_10970 [Clostridia bacterium]|nr:hypothetical protein FACS1894202_10970 [Clostridia bacterium]